MQAVSESVRAEMSSLKEEAGFYISQGLFEEILRAAHEL